LCASHYNERKRAIVQNCRKKKGTVWSEAHKRAWGCNSMHKEGTKETR